MCIHMFECKIKEYRSDKIKGCSCCPSLKKLISKTLFIASQCSPLILLLKQHPHSPPLLTNQRKNKRGVVVWDWPREEFGHALLACDKVGGVFLDVIPC